MKVVERDTNLAVKILFAIIALSVNILITCCDMIEKSNDKFNIEEEFFEAVLALKNTEEARKFFRDLCTIQEIESAVFRFQIVKMLDAGLSYRQISQKTGASTTTITRVAHWYHHGMGGYKLVLERLKDK